MLYFVQTDFMNGAMCAGYAMAALFFLRYWRESRDRLFAFFSLAFFLLAGRCILLPWFPETDRWAVFPYVYRLVCYLIILAAIVDKNLRKA